MRNPIPKELLIELYQGERLSMRAIAQRLKRSDATVYSYMREYGIESRPQNQLKGRPKSQTAIDKHRKTLIGRKHSDQHKAKISATHKGRTHDWAKKRTMVHNYVALFEPNNPMSNSVGYVYEHRKVMAENIGRPLLKSELVHHVNGIKTDNRLENLQIVSRFEHSQIHSGELTCPHCNHTFRYVTQINSARGSHN